MENLRFKLVFDQLALETAEAEGGAGPDISEEELKEIIEVSRAAFELAQPDSELTTST